MSNIETKLVGKIGFRIFLYYATTTILATTLSIVLVLTITPGSRTQINNETIAGSESIQSTNEDNAMDIIRYVNNKFYSIKGIRKE
jgi:Na+/H+-dicarboxylate symporter